MIQYIFFALFVSVSAQEIPKEAIDNVMELTMAMDKFEDELIYPIKRKT